LNAILIATGEHVCPPALESAVRARGVTVHRSVPDAAAIARLCFGGPSLVLLDESDAGAALLAGAMTALGFQVVVRGDHEGKLPDGPGLRLPPGLSPEVEAHHLCDVLRTANEARRHPRVPWRGQAIINGVEVQILDISPFGLRIHGASWPDAGEHVVTVRLGASGPEIRLLAQAAGRHGDDLALRCRPERDVDLVLWVDLILRELASSPKHRESDPFGPLFEP
jgi:hypothetical protein